MRLKFRFSKFVSRIPARRAGGLPANGGVSEQRAWSKGKDEGMLTADHYMTIKGKCIYKEYRSCCVS